MKKKMIKAFERELSIVAFGGVIVMDESQDDANAYVKEAIESGVNYFDVAPSYGDAELRLGPALEQYREDVFLACKTMERTKEGALKELEQSLKNLKTDYFDLYQFHAVFDLEDVDTIFAPGGAIEAFKQAKSEGKIRNIGFSAHSTEAALAMMERFDFDSILFPFNFVSLIKNGYGAYVLNKAIDKEMAILGIKSMALTEHQKSDRINHPKAWYHPIEDKILASKAVRYTISKSIDIIVPPGNINHFRWACEIMNESLEIEDDDIKYLKEIADNHTPLFPLKAR